jgi:hypothetical protein
MSSPSSHLSAPFALASSSHLLFSTRPSRPSLRVRKCHRVEGTNLPSIPTLRRTFTGREARKHTHALPGQVRVGNSNELEQGGAHGTFTRQDGLASCTIVRGRVGNWLRWLVEWFVATIVLVTCSVD